MSDKPQPQPASESPQNGRRRAPIIDLTATEIRSDESQPSPSETAGEGGSSGAKEKSKFEYTALKNAMHARVNRFAIAILATGVLSTVVGFVLAVLLWSKDVPQSSGASDLNAQIIALQGQITNLHNRLMANDPTVLDALMARTAKIETSIANLAHPNGGGAAPRLNAAETAIKSLRETSDALYSRSDDIAGQIKRASEKAGAAEQAVTQLRSEQRAAQIASAAIDPNLLNSLQQRMDRLEQSIKDTNAEIVKFTTAEKSTLLAFAANTLRAAVMTGAPYRDELKQVQFLYSDSGIFAALEPFAATGLVSEITLGQELRNLIPEIKKEAVQAEAAGGFLQQLQVNFRDLVRITPLDAPQSDRLSDVLARLDAAAARSDSAAALSELMKLSERIHAPAQTWIKKVEARQAALNAAQLLAVESTRHLGVE